jgi:ABC-type glucose/galactose transport system permease subunit
MPTVRPFQAWILIFLLAAASPFFINVALLQVVSITTEPMARATLEFFPEHDSFVLVVRVLNALLVGLLIAVVLGIPLAFLVTRQFWVRCLAFVLAVVTASAAWHLNQQWGVAGFVQQWSYTEMWLSILGACAVAALISGASSRHELHRVVP